jgi:hypothetical protein
MHAAYASISFIPMPISFISEAIPPARIFPVRHVVAMLSLALSAPSRPEIR